MSHAILVNDMQAARAEARGQYGAHANAEELIRAHQASISPEVRATQRKPLNEEATRTLDRSKIEVPEGGTLIDAVVRGNAISYVWEDAQGNWRKGVSAYDDSYVGPEVKVGDAVLSAQTEREVEQREKVIDWRVEMEEKLAETRREMEAEFAEKLAKLREEHSGEIEKLQADAEKAAADRDEADPQSPATGTKSGGTSKAEKQQDKKQNERKAGEG